MLKKCLKYDLAAVFRVVWILLIIMLVAVVAAGGSLRICIESAQFLGTEPHDPSPIIMFPAFLGVFGGYFSAIGCFIAAVGCATVCTILTYWRVYSNFFTDEGYLTFTLPVKRSTLYLSKVITCTVVELASICVVLVGGIFAVLVAIPFDAYPLIPEFFKNLGTAFTEIGGALSVWPLVWLLLMPLIAVTNTLASNGLVLLCLMLGSAIFKKGKLIASIGIYWLINRLVGVVAEFITFPLAFGMSGLMLVMESAGGFAAGLSVTVAILIAVAMTACGAALLHFINLTILERKLNLA